MAKTLAEGQEILEKTSRNPFAEAMGRLRSQLGGAGEVVKSEDAETPAVTEEATPEVVEVLAETPADSEVVATETLEKGMSAPPEEEEDEDQPEADAGEGGEPYEDEDSEDEGEPEEDGEEDADSDDESTEEDAPADDEADSEDDGEEGSEDEDSEGSEDEDSEDDDEDEDSDEEEAPVRKSIDEADGPEDLIAAIRQSPYASQIDNSDALLATVDEFAFRLDQQRKDTLNLQRQTKQIAKSVGNLEQLNQTVGMLTEMVGALVEAAERTLLNQREITKSLLEINSGVELVKSQPVTGGGWGTNFNRPPVRGVEVQGKVLAKSDVQAAIVNGGNSGAITPAQAAQWLGALDGAKGLEGVVKELPESILAHLK